MPRGAVRCWLRMLGTTEGVGLWLSCAVSFFVQWKRRQSSRWWCRGSLGHSFDVVPFPPFLRSGDSIMSRLNDLTRCSGGALKWFPQVALGVLATLRDLRAR